MRELPIPHLVAYHIGSLNLDIMGVLPSTLYILVVYTHIKYICDFFLSFSVYNFVSFTLVSVYYMCAWCLWRSMPSQGIGYP